MVQSKGVYKISPADAAPSEPKRMSVHMEGKFAGYIAEGVAWRITKDRQDWRTGALNRVKPSRTMKELEAWGLPDFGGRELYRAMRQSLVHLPNVLDSSSGPVKRSSREATAYTMIYHQQTPTGRVVKKTVKFRAWDDIHAWQIAEDTLSEGRVFHSLREEARVYCGDELVPRQ